MYLNIISHNAKNGASSSSVFQYLDKENTEEKIKHQYLKLEGREDEINPNSVEHFFNQDFNPYDLDDENSRIDVYKASEQIDKNRGIQPLSASNFYMLNISPSEKEQEHMIKIAEEELANRGLKYESCVNNSEALEFYEEQKDQLMKLQMKLYIKEVMEEYARQIDREIYAHQDKLPDNAQRKEMQPEIEKRYNLFLEEKGLKEKVGKDYVLVNYDEKIKSKLNEGNTYIFNYQGRQEEVFAMQNKVRELDNNTIAIEKAYFEDKIQESKDKIAGIYNDDKVRLKVQIDNKAGNSTQITLKPDDYDSEVKMWLNNKDFKELKNGEIEINKYRAEKLINKAVERDKEQKQLVEINYIDTTQKEIKSKESEKKENMITFYKSEEGLTKPIQLTFKEDELKKVGDKYFVEKYKLDYRTEKAKELGIKYEFGDKKEEIKHQVWRENGFDPTKRKVEGKDLMYFAKVEKERTYKHTDKAVLKNRPILKKIEEYQASKNPLKKMKIGDLEKLLLRDRHTGEIIKEGVKKGGLQYHTHIILSRHDKTSINPRDKVSMSPNAHQRGGKLNNGAKVGFDRNTFFEKAEQIFDEKFEYERPSNEKYTEINKESKNYSNIAGHMKGRVKSEIMKQMGLNIVKNELNPTQKIRQEIMPLPIPTSIPKSKIDIAIKVIKMAKNLVIDRGVGY